MINLENKNILITGGLGILGKSLIPELALLKANVIVVDIQDIKNIKNINNYEILKNKIFYYKSDVSKKANVEKVKLKILKKFKKLNVLINAAAITDAIEKKNLFNSSKFENFSFKSWKKSINVNLNSLFLCSQIFGKELIKNKTSSIINIGSTYGIVGPDQNIYKNKLKKKTFYKSPSYPTTKGAAISFTRYLAAYWGNKGLRVNTVSPGGIFNKQDKNFLKKYSSKTLLNRMAKPEEISSVIAFLCSDRSTYITGSNIVVDGGWTAI